MDPTPELDTTTSEEEMLASEVELTEEEQAALEEEAAKEEKARQAILDDLALSIEAKFTDRASRRITKETEWLSSAKLYYGSLSIHQGSGRTSDRPFGNTGTTNRPDVNIVRSKCAIAIAQCVSMQFAGGEKNWDLVPSPDDRTPEAADKSHKMSNTIETQLENCQYGRESRRAMSDMVILGTGILKGPVNTGKLRTVYEQIQTGEEIMWVPKASVDKTPTIEYVNPWFFYPDDTVNDFNYTRDALQVHPKSAIELKKLMDHGGFDKAAIALVLKDKPSEYKAENYSEYATLTDSNPYLFSDKYTVLEYHGPVTATQLETLEINPSYNSLNEEYYGEVWVCQGKVIRIELENIEACFELPYAVAVWEKDPSSVFGFGAPQLMKDAQRVVTQTWHMILDNASLSSGPQVAMHKGYIEPADNSWDMAPRKAWYLTDQSINVDNAIQFFNVPNVQENLMPVMELARMFAEEESMTPAIAGGMESPQATESATGALIMRSASTTLLDFKAEEWDDSVTEKIIRRMYGWNMQYSKDDYIKGNYGIDVRSSTEYKNKQLHLRDLEKLSLEATQNPELGILLNMEEISRARLAMMKLPSGKIVRTTEEVAVAREEAAKNQPPDPNVLKAQTDQMKLELEAARLRLEEQKLQFDAQQNQQREAWEHEEKMSANFARLREAEAMVLRTQNEKEIQILQLASRSENEAQKNAIMSQIATQNNETKTFLKAMEETRKQQEALLVEKELDLANKTGKGI